MKVSALALLATTATVAHAANIKPLILSGTVVPAGTKEYTVGLRMEETGEAFCDGTLISPTHVLTAAHCAGFKFAAIGSHFLSGDADGERIAIAREIPHPLFNYSTGDHDVSILELARPSKYTPVQLLSADLETVVGEKATIMGWGLTSENGAPAQELLRVDVPVVADAVCRSIKWSEFNQITDAMFCAGGEPNKDSCAGDSGGPLILEKPTGDVLIGVVSWGEGCGLANFPGVYAKVSYVKDWIRSLAPDAVFV